MLSSFTPAFERYTLPARRVIWSAIQEAHALGDQSLTAEHLALGLVRHDSDLVQKYLHDSNIQALVASLRPGTAKGPAETCGDLLLEPSAKAVLKAAEDLARACHASAVGPLHLLGGALQAKTPIAEIFTSHGAAFADVLRALSPPADPAAGRA